MSTPAKQQLISARIREALKKYSPPAADKRPRQAKETPSKTEAVPTGAAFQDGNLGGDLEAKLTELSTLSYAGDLAESAAKKGSLNYVKEVLRRLLRPMWERQTNYNLVNQSIVQELTKSLIEIKQDQTNLYLRTLRYHEEKFEGLIGLIDEEISERDRRIEILEEKLAKLENQHIERQD